MPVRPSLSNSPVAGLLLVAASSAFAASSAPAASAPSTYEQERAKCLDGSSNQDRATCLKEAGAARDQAKKGQLGEGDANYRKNAKARCDALSGDEAKDCVARMHGGGTVSGSVPAGGILRETVTHEKTVLPPVPAASAR